MHQPKRYSTVKNLPSLYPGANFAESSIRWLIFNAKENGFDYCIRRVMGKILIDLQAFEEWMDNEELKGKKSKGDIKPPKNKRKDDYSMSKLEAQLIDDAFINGGFDEWEH
jgi:hypothetical protein